MVLGSWPQDYLLAQVTYTLRACFLICKMGITVLTSQGYKEALIRNQTKKSFVITTSLTMMAD